MSDSGNLDRKHERNLADRREQIKQWAEYVRTNPDRDWSQQVNTLVNAQIQSARAQEDDRPSMDELRDSPLLDED
ncbi:hypothetical protein ACOZ4N_19915 [Halorientalis pallida]|uniref:hypothetical protein n=1 Tax=Halorientalis pallida TaxID=2479928 RepID=UPI003C6FAE12